MLRLGEGKAEFRRLAQHSTAQHSTCRQYQSSRSSFWRTETQFCSLTSPHASDHCRFVDSARVAAALPRSRNQNQRQSPGGLGTDRLEKAQEYARTTSWADACPFLLATNRRSESATCLPCMLACSTLVYRTPVECLDLARMNTQFPCAQNLPTLLVQRRLGVTMMTMNRTLLAKFLWFHQTNARCFAVTDTTNVGHAPCCMLSPSTSALPQPGSETQPRITSVGAPEEQITDWSNSSSHKHCGEDHGH